VILDSPPCGFKILFDLWVEVWRKKVAKGDVIVVRFADGTPVQTSN
jgi:hypothetical protein